MEPAIIWDCQPDKNVSLVDHYKGFSICLMKLFREAGSRGIIVVSPEIAAIIDTNSGFKEVDNWSVPAIGPAKVGMLYGHLEVWVDVLHNITTVGVFDKPNGTELARMRVVNYFGRDWTPLDDLARL
jgi:hypothetical protein